MLRKREFFPMDLKPYANHKFFYDSLPQNLDGHGLNGMLLLINQNPELKNLTVRGVPYILCFGERDNIVCLNQEIAVRVEASKIYFLGFAYWGDENETVTVITDGNRERKFMLKLKECSYSFQNNPWQSLYSTDFESVYEAFKCKTDGAAAQDHYFTVCVCDLEQAAFIEKIILPDNILMHIAAITLRK